MSRLERLINLTAALLDASRPLTRADVEERVPGYEGDPATRRRAFERDKEALRAMGIPIVTELRDPDRPEETGYRISKEEYALPDPRLAPDELAALHLAASVVRLDGGEAVEAIWKLGGAPAEAPAAGALVALPGNEHLPALFAAASQRAAVRFRYRDGDRTVDPYRLSFRNGHWYLAGFDHERGDVRSYRVDRIASAPEAGPPAAFERPRSPAAPNEAAPPWQMGDEEPVHVRVLVDASQADWAAGFAGPEAVHEQRPDGSVVLDLLVTNRDALRSWVLGFLDHAEVLAPDDLRAGMIGWLEELAR